MMKKNLIKILISNPKKLFLIDGVGAMLSAFLLAGVLPMFEDRIGLPLDMLYSLSILPFIYSLYSLSCSFFVTRNWKFFFRIIAIANLFYCCVTIVVMILFFPQLTFIGLIYFVLELIVVACLVAVEFSFGVRSSSTISPRPDALTISKKNLV